MYIGFRVRYPLFLSDINKPDVLSTGFRKINIKFNENRSSGNRVVPCGRIVGQTDMTKLKVDSRNYMNALKKNIAVN